MQIIVSARLAILLLLLTHLAYATPADERPIICDGCAAWNRPRAPFLIHGNTTYVGVAGLSALLVKTSAGLVLLDGDLPQSAATIEANLRALGHRPSDVKLILTSHGHYDHVGGVAALQRRTGALVVASASTAAALRTGKLPPSDPQRRSLRARIPIVRRLKVVRDGGQITVGEVTFTAHLTPGHAPGGTTWTWRSCEREVCVDMVYADSLTPISDEGFRFTGDASHPSLVPDFERSIALVEGLPCDVLVTVHPDFMDVDDKLAARAAHPELNPFVDPGACRRYAAAARRRLAARIATE